MTLPILLLLLLSPAAMATDMLGIGKIGIGTTVPSAQIDLKGSLSSALTGTVSVTSGNNAVLGSGTAFTTELAIGDSIKIGSEIFTVSAITDATHLTLDSNHGTGASGVTAYRDLTFFVIDNGDAVNKLTITRSGNVGIGTTGPAYKLDVNGNTRLGGANSRLYLSTSGYAVINRGAGGSQDIYFGETADTGKYIFRSSGAMTIEGNVGIGTTVPDDKLEVNGNLRLEGPSDVGIVFNPGAAAYTSSIYVRNEATTGAEAFRIYTRGASPFSDTLRMGITSAEATADVYFMNSNVGIGTTGPGAQLQIHLPTATTATVNSLLISRWTRPQTGGVKYGNSMDILLGSYGTSINSQSRVDFKLADGATDLPDTTVMTLQGNGKVGIGTTGPGQLLELGTGSILLNRRPATQVSEATTFVGIGDGDGTFGVDNPNGAIAFEVDSTGSQQLKFITHEYGGTYGTRMTIAKSGNVGIGTTSPSGRLHVGGNVVIMGDKLVDADGSTTTNPGSAAAISEDATLVVVEAADSLCTDSLTAPTKLRIDTDSNCATAGGTVLLGDGTGTAAAGSTWAFSDTVVANSAYDDGEDIYIDNAPSLVYTSGRVGIGTTSPVNNLHVAGSARIDGDLMLIGKLANVQVSTLNVNGSILPPTALDNSLDLGSASERWRTGYFGTNVIVGGNSVLTTATVHGGDVSGAYNALSVDKIKGVALGTTTATAGNLLIGSGTQWVSNAVTGDVTIASNGVTSIGTGKVTSAMILDGTIADADVSGSAAIAGTKISPNFGAQNLVVDTNVLYVDATGDKVGIGTTVPDKSLTIQLPTNDWAGGLNIKYWGAGNPVLAFLRRESVSYGGGELVLANDAGNINTIIRGGGPSYFNAGNVGIGTTGPKAKLDINGNLGKGTKTLAITSSWSDVLVVDMGADHRSAYLKLWYGGADWGSHSAPSYYAEMTLKDGNGGYGEPGSVRVSSYFADGCDDYIESQLVHDTNPSNIIRIQMRTNDKSNGFCGTTSTTSSSSVLAYEIAGLFSTIT